MKTQEIDARFKDAPWYAKASSHRILVGGAGGIGSNALYYLTKTIPAHYFVFDFDTVDIHNIGTQFFGKSQLGELKVNAIKKVLEDYSNAKIIAFNQAFTKDTGNMDIMLSCFDNMKARKIFYECWKERNSGILIDGRLRATYYEIFVVTPERCEEYEKTLFEDIEVDEGPCTFKQAAFTAGLIGARMTHILVNYLTNLHSKEDICELPFHIEESTELFYINIEAHAIDNKEAQ